MENLKNKKIWIIGVVVCIVIGGMFVINATRKEKIDILSCCEVSYAGADRLGRPVRNCDLPWKDASEEDSLAYNAFLADIAFMFDKKENLSNGDEVQLSLVYDKELADEFKVSIDEGPKTFKVEGLPKAYLEWKEVPKSLQSDLLSFMDNLTKEGCEDFFARTSSTGLFFGQMNELKQMKRMAYHYTFNNDEVHGVLHALYRVDYTVTDNFTETVQEKTTYYSIILPGIVPEKVMDDYQKLWTLKNTFLNPKGNEEDKEEDVLKDYEETFSNEKN